MRRRHRHAQRCRTALSSQLKTATNPLGSADGKSEIGDQIAYEVDPREQTGKWPRAPPRISEKIQPPTARAGAERQSSVKPRKRIGAGLKPRGKIWPRPVRRTPDRKRRQQRAAKAPAKKAPARKARQPKAPLAKTTPAKNDACKDGALQKSSRKETFAAAKPAAKKNAPKKPRGQKSVHMSASDDIDDSAAPLIEGIWQSWRTRRSIR